MQELSNLLDMIFHSLSALLSEVVAIPSTCKTTRQDLIAFVRVIAECINLGDASDLLYDVKSVCI